MSHLHDIHSCHRFWLPFTSPVLLQVATLPLTPAGPPQPPQPASPDSATSISTAIHSGDWHHTSYSRPAPEMTQQTQGMLDKVMLCWDLACRPQEALM